MIIAFLGAWVSALSLPLVFLFKVTWDTFRKYHLSPFLVANIITLLGILYLILTLLGNLSPNPLIAFYIFNSSIILMGIIAIFVFIYFRLLRTEKLSISIISICVFLILLKIFSLIINPIGIYYYHEVYIREAHLTDLALLAPLITILLIIIEVSLLFKETRGNPMRKKYSKHLLAAYFWIALLVPTFMIGKKFRIISIFIPYLEGTLTSMIALYLSLIFYENPERLILLPVKFKGFLLHTYGGLAIIRKALDPRFEHIIPLASSLVASIVSLETAIEKPRAFYLFRVHKLIETTIIMFFGRITVGTFILSHDNIIVRDILKRIVLEFEEIVSYIDEGMITDEEISLAEKILDKYIEFLS